MENLIRNKITVEGNDFFSIKNNKDLEIEFCQLGAAIYSVKYKNKVITYHPADRKVFLTTGKYSGKIVGRTCGRLADGKIEIDGKPYQIQVNEAAKNNCLHGGNDGISFKKFAYSVTEDDKTIKVIFKYTSPNNEAGFPAKVDFVVTYVIEKEVNTFTIKMLATPDAKTILNMTTHIYWRLGGNDILDHTLYVDAGKRMIGHPERMFNMQEATVENWYNFQKPKKVGQDIFEVAKASPNATRGYDHAWIFNNPTNGRVTLSYEGTTLDITTDFSMANIYADCWNDPIEMLTYGLDKQYGAIAIEPQLKYTTYSDLICEAGKAFDHYIKFELK